MLRKAVDVLLEERIPELVAVNDAEDFTKWHHSICEEIVARYEAEGIEFYVGQAQKWVNMTLKYLYVLVPDVVESVLPFFTYSAGQLHHRHCEEAVWHPFSALRMEQNIGLPGLS